VKKSNVVFSRSQAGIAVTPPVKNYALYLWRVLVKWLSFFIFGCGSVVLMVIIFPAARLVLHSKERFQRYGHWCIYASFNFFIFVMRVIGVARLKTEQREAFRKLRGKIIVANHPSLLDVVMLISLIPNADCIVNAYLLKHFLTGIVRQLYIPNSLDFDELAGQCGESLGRGNCLIIFPEGTRTPRSGPVIVKKGAARLSLLSGKPIVPVRIGGNDKWGLGKKDPWWAYNPAERYLYDITMLPEIYPQAYAGLPGAIAAKRLTDDIKNVLFPER
jgi:1-acyl-sn-glycerol-3-phosphate acyltransferase